MLDRGRGRALEVETAPWSSPDPQRTGSLCDHPSRRNAPGSAGDLAKPGCLQSRGASAGGLCGPAGRCACVALPLPQAGKCSRERSVAQGGSSRHMCPSPGPLLPSKSTGAEAKGTQASRSVKDSASEATRPGSGPLSRLRPPGGSGPVPSSSAAATTWDHLQVDSRKLNQVSGNTSRTLRLSSLVWVVAAT